MRTEILSIALVALACAPPAVPSVTPNDAYGTDAAHVDMGVVVVADMGPRDTGPMDAPDTNVDANLPDTGPVPDAGSGAIRIDGVLDEPIWTANALNPPLTNAAPAGDPFMGDALSRIVYARDADWLYVGFEGTLVSGDAIVVYVDVNATAGGVLLMGSGLGDTFNTVNAVASLPITANALFQPDVLWGSSMLPSGGTSIVYAPELGWRRLAMVGAFSPIATGTHSACSATGCETAIAWASIGVTASAPVQLVARLGRAGTTMAFCANQLFPTDATGSPEMISGTISVAP